MKKYIACRVRNSIDIIKDFMSHYESFDGFFFYDDQSDDGTREYLESHPKSVVVNDVEPWKPSSWRDQVAHRSKACKRLLKSSDPEDWMFLLDSDEFISFEPDVLNENRVVTLNLYDAVITKDDKDSHFLDRRWFEKSARKITFAVRCGDFKEITGHRTIRVKSGSRFSDPCGVVRHFGRARSLEKFDEKCDYYVKHAGLGSYKEKWSARKGNGVTEINLKKHFNWDEVYGSNADNVEIRKDEKSS